MRPTKSKEQLAYYKHLLAIDKKRKELANRKDDEDNYIEIPRMLIGYRIKLIPVDSLKNRDDGLAEAVAASTSWFRFSDKAFRLCNLKSYRCELWHYEGWKTSRYRKWERDVTHKQIRAQSKVELEKAVREYFETV